ncbi:hypothetical protein P3T21_007808, partial [Paraburkholderia sp. GAS334]
SQRGTGDSHVSQNRRLMNHASLFNRHSGARLPHHLVLTVV